MKRHFFRAAAGLLAVALLLPSTGRAVAAQSALLLDGTTGRVLYEKQADERSLIASCTKIMTALLICEQCNVLDRVKIPEEAVGVEGSSMYLRAGEILTVQELLYGLMLRSGNDAAVALAIYCGGTLEGFVELMNDKARRLGLNGTHFENPHGLDAPQHYSTARDLAALSAYAMKNPVFAKTVSTKTVRIGERILTNHNKLLWRVAGADGIKTGYTKAAGRILVSSALRDGRRLICVTVNDANDWADHGALLEEGFSAYRIRQLVQKGQEMGTCPVVGGERDCVQLLAAEDFSFALSCDERVEITVRTNGVCFAPVVHGAKAGAAYVLVDGKTVGKIPLVYAQTVEIAKEEPKHFWQRWFP